MEDLGQRLRQARQDLGWTLETLSARSGLSTGFLSQVERGQSTLSIVSLSAICQALALPIETLFMSNRPLDEIAPVVTQAEHQLHIQIGESPVSYGYLTRQLPDAPIRELLIAEFPAGTSPSESTHEGEEFGYVLEGRLRLRVRGEEHELGAGDSYRVAAAEPHDYATSDDAARVLMAVTQRFIDLRPRAGRGRGGAAHEVSSVGRRETKETSEE
jgi:transcriptional regulator with XRE-family HTH domain